MVAAPMAGAPPDRFVTGAGPLPGAASQEVRMEPLAWLGILAIIIGIVGVIVLLKGRKKKVR